MNMLGKLSLRMNELNTTTAFYCRIFGGANLLRQYTNTPQENGNNSESSNKIIFLKRNKNNYNIKFCFTIKIRFF